MTDNKNNDDIFLQSIGKVVPLKKNENIKPIKKITIKTNKETKIKTNKETKIKIKIKEKTVIKTTNFKIKSTPVEKNIKKGKILINRKIDFHGYSVNQARKKFLNEIEVCFYSNKRCILFITGKGLKKASKPEEPLNTKLFHGKIRENFLKWVNEEDVSSKILSVVSAGISYGGDGAFFVYLRKNRY